jgi:hypothetical protein
MPTTAPASAPTPPTSGERKPVWKRQADEREARRARHHPALMARQPVRTEHRQADPVDGRAEPGAPDHGVGIDGASIGEHGPALADFLDAPDPLDARPVQVGATDPHHWSAAVGAHPVAHPAAKRRLERHRRREQAQ